MEELATTTNSKLADNLNKLINYKKQKITTLFFQTQNFIIKNCFNYEFNYIRTLEDIHNFKNKLYDFKNIIGSNPDYVFYNDFYRSMMQALDIKKQEIINRGEINMFSSDCTSLIIVDSKKNKLAFVKTFFRKLKELFKSEISRDYINM